MFNKRLGLSLPRVLTNQVLDLHEAGDHKNLLKTKSRHLIGQPEYLDSSTILVVTWRDLIGLHSWLQRYKSRIGITPDPSSLLRRGWPARLGCIRVKRGQDVIKSRTVVTLSWEGYFWRFVVSFNNIFNEIHLFIFIFFPAIWVNICSQPVRETCNQFGMA